MSSATEVIASVLQLSCDLRRYYLPLSRYTTETRDQTPLDSDDALKHMVDLTFVKVAHYDQS